MKYCCGSRSRRFGRGRIRRWYGCRGYARGVIGAEVLISHVALVTGANGGIGFAIAERLLRDGFALGYATNDRGDDDREAFERLSQLGRVHWVDGDLTDAAVPGRLVAGTLEALGRLDVLVNNAGLSTAGPALELTAEDFDRTFAVDVKAAFLLSQHAARAMEGRGGSIVNITSVHEHVPRPNFALYAAAKAALGMLTRGLALELAPLNIRVNAVAPGAIATERNAEADSLAPQIPLGRAGKPEEVAALVSYLASDAAGYVTGASFVIDGGLIQQVVSQPAG
ncbi:MAG: SDR family NAD(P)-dependent oxidoreductase [Gaiellaceae bacterium]